MHLRLRVVVDTYKDDGSVVVSHLAIIFLFADLLNSSMGRLVFFQLKQDGGATALFSCLNFDVVGRIWRKPGDGFAG